MKKNNKYKPDIKNPKYNSFEDETKQTKKCISFSYAILIHNKKCDYKREQLKNDFYVALLEMMKIKSSKTPKEVCSNLVNNSHDHAVKSDKKELQENFHKLLDLDSLHEEYSSVVPWQLGFEWKHKNSTINSRIVGYFIENVFYIRIIDVDHNLYPKK